MINPTYTLPILAVSIWINGKTNEKNIYWITYLAEKVNTEDEKHRTTDVGGLKPVIWLFESHSQLTCENLRRIF